jgi:hypothetical protein
LTLHFISQTTVECKVTNTFWPKASKECTYFKSCTNFTNSPHHIAFYGTSAITEYTSKVAVADISNIHFNPKGLSATLDPVDMGFWTWERPNYASPVQCFYHI